MPFLFSKRMLPKSSQPKLCMTSYFLHLSHIFSPFSLDIVTSVLGGMYVGYSQSLTSSITHLISQGYKKVYILFWELLTTSYSFLSQYITRIQKWDNYAPNIQSQKTDNIMGCSHIYRVWGNPNLRLLDISLQNVWNTKTHKHHSYVEWWKPREVLAARRNAREEHAPNWLYINVVLQHPIALCLLFIHVFAAISPATHTKSFKIQNLNFKTL
jgi:hypothetical protein